MKKQAEFWEPTEGGIRCLLCPRLCSIPEGKTGFCGARKNEGGKLYTLIYGTVTAANPDPIEKKPLHHFWPGSLVFSLSSVGCNFKCDFCQNWELSQSRLGEVYTRELAPEEAVEGAKETECSGIAFTYNEPSIWWEYCYDVSKLAKKEGLYTVMVTNGYLNLPAWEKLSPYLDAANVDVKAFTDRFYRKFPGVPSLKPVLESCEWLVRKGKHLEVTYLLIPGENDDPEEIREFCRWVREKLSPDIPVHFSRFFPHYKLKGKPSTPLSTLERAKRIAREEGIEFVYLGNVALEGAEDTLCPSCGELLVKREGFSVLDYKLKNGKCPKCGRRIRMVGKFEGGRSWWIL
ncbi:MAG: AmmeMemoRadiSam system radical SAM enzyme [Hadesarchaea archaeon]|nr:MAG: AmmeMemoRadiSam system radical SAM enzyme [Hadesarchaea archaeon]